MQVANLGLVARYTCSMCSGPSGHGLDQGPPQGGVVRKGDCGSDTDNRYSPLKTKTQNMHMLCSRNLSVLVQCELQVDRIKIHVMQLRVINSGGLLR